MTTIRAAHYGETIAALKADPIIIEMAATITKADVAGGIHGTGFMQAALAEYNRRGGRVNTHIGGPAEAIAEIVNDRA